MSVKGVREAGGGVLLEVAVVPGAPEAGVDGRDPWRGALKVRVRGPPAKGKANAELVELLARRFGLAPADVVIVSGLRSRRKVVRLEGLCLDDVVGLLEVTDESG